MRRLLLLALIWGWSFLFIKVAVEGFTPTTVAAGRCGLGSLTLTAVLRARGVAFPRDPRLLRHLLLVGLVGSAVPFTMLAWSEERITSALTAVLNASTPLFTAALAATVLGERLRVPQVVGLVAGLAGVGVAAGVGAGDLRGASLLGALGSVAAGACYGFAFTWARRHLMGVTPLVAAWGQVTSATLLLLPVAVATSVGSGFDPTPRRLGAIVLLGALGTGLAYVLSFGVIAELGPTRASLVTYLIPVVAVAVGVGVLDESLHVRVALGGALIVAGILAVNRYRADGPRAGGAAGPVAGAPAVDAECPT